VWHVPVDDRGQTGLAIAVEIGAAPLLEVLFGLVADARATGSAHGATHDCAGRPTDGTAHDGTGRGTAERTGASTGLVVGTLGGLTGHGTADRADRPADHGAWGPTDGCADCGTAERAGSGAHGLATDLTFSGRIPAVHRSVAIVPFELGVEGIGVGIDPTRVVRSVHLGASWDVLRWGA
jgi:hypothetical protein